MLNHNIRGPFKDSTHNKTQIFFKKLKHKVFAEVCFNCTTKSDGLLNAFMERPINWRKSKIQTGTELEHSD